jgi:hypothetical protein
MKQLISVAGALVLVALIVAMAIYVARMREDQTSAPPQTNEASAVSPHSTPTPTEHHKSLQKWLDSYKSASPADREALLAEGIELAKQRRAWLLNLIQTDPAAALAAALSEEELAALPPEIAALAERRIDQRAFYGVLVICGDHDPSEPHGSTCRIEREVRLGGMLDPNRLIAHTFGTGLNRQTEENGRVVGILIDDQIAVAPPDADTSPATPTALSSPIQ